MLCILEAVKGWLYLLDVLEVLDVMRCMMVSRYVRHPRSPMKGDHVS